MDRENHTNNHKVKLMCSYGGKIQCRPHDHALIYAGGDTKILTVDRTVKFRDLILKLAALSNCGPQFCLKYQLPGEGLDALVSVMDDDDVEHLMVEYDRIHRISAKPARLRLFLFPVNRSVNSGSSLTPDFLFGFDEYPAETEKGIQRNAGQSMGWSYGFQAPFVYGMPAPAYSYLPVVPVFKEQRVPVGGHVAQNQTVKGDASALNHEFKGPQVDS